MLARHRVVAVAAASILLGALVQPLAAAADEAPPLEQMTEFPAAEFAAEASEVPAELAEALARDVDLTPEEYLAQAAASQLAVEVVDGLEAAGVGVVASRLEGTELVVNVETEADAALVESTGATAKLGQPEPLWDPSGLTPEFAADVYGGQGWIFPGAAGWYQCSLGFGGKALPSGQGQIATAGHCTEDMISNGYILNQQYPNDVGTQGVALGSRIAGTTTVGTGLDVGRIGGGSHVLKPYLAQWGGAAGAPLSSLRSVTGDAQPVTGTAICKSGSKTGWSCGTVVETDYLAEICVQNCGGSTSDDVIQTVRSVVAQICVRSGDSGGAAVLGNKAIGITSWATGGSSPCSTETYAGFFQMVSPGGLESVASAYGSTWELNATVTSPTVTASPSGSNNTTLSGTVPHAGIRYTVDVHIDGSPTPFATANVNAGTGGWSVNVSSLPAGLHSYSAIARYGTQSVSAPTTGYLKRGMNIDRIQAANRYLMAVEISKKAYPSGGAPVVYVTNGATYPDALSAGPAAALQGGVMLLSTPTTLPVEVRDEIIRLGPARIVVVGGTATVPADVYNALAALQPNIERIGGANRYEASRNIVADAFSGENPTTAYIATGKNFPDALGASAAGAAFGWPVILVDGTATTLDSATITLLNNLGVDEIKVAGGPASVSNGIFNALKAVDPTPTRLSGANRYEASANIAIDAFGAGAPERAYLATGLNFPDALAGGPLAAQTASPILAVRDTCVPAESLSALQLMESTHVTLLGGTASLGTGVASLTRCA
ncbi:putative cell wall-binding protein [Microbacteriaceae bacterium SG_E_30_P1]|uniref:Cell wall-binding protein n=1 Tax=Antiquaquibacter oligotrophicus TaxID=2880260 RepID=A0ABT6KP05_9MICO|nr:cell wall-binding repeat-containing protein [Antiquaquibacter oligotrophicus]MDH6181726.1 putative cell wall-binding protein [Antiquaquibacter oligotrophicus]UDF12591.1 cell wall-binding repeat-containing protein [Antiquaquibacter oligotrophicus]